MRLLQWLLAFSLLAPLARADDWYVDAVHGDDANSGQTPAQAWRTLTHALATVPVPPAGSTERIHVAAGLHDTALGEAFPLHPGDGFEVIGAGPDLTIVDAGGAAAAFDASVSHLVHHYTGPLTLLAGLTVRNAGDGVFLGSALGELFLRCEDLSIVDCDFGLRSLSTTSSGFVGQVHATLERVRIAGCGVGLSFRNDASGSFAPATTELRDCAILGSASFGIDQYDQGTGTTLTCVRTRLEGNGADGIRVRHQNPLSVVTTRVTLDDCLLAANTGSGLFATVPGPWIIQTSLFVELTRCTVAGNLGRGIDLQFPAGTSTHFETALDSTILYGNQDDVLENPASPSIVSVRFCDVGDGDFAGSNGNFALDPRFRDPASGDWRLVWESPCVDAGDPATPVGVLDLALEKRPVDGDLDVAERSDVGALEFTPLSLASVPQAGGSLVLEHWGPMGGRAILYLARGPTVAVPLTTLFGEFDLDTSVLRNLGTARVGAGPPVLRVLPIPDDPAYVGQTWSLQALASSSVALPPAAYTNALTVTIGP